MITFFGRSSSDSVQKALWMLAETGQPFEHIQLGGRFGGLDDPDYLERNPHGRIPTLMDGDVTVWESNAIIRYLAARYCAGSVWPNDPAERAKADQWMEWGQTQLYPTFNRLFWLSIRTPGDEQNRDEIDGCAQKLAEYYRILDRQLKDQDYVAGHQLTIADIPTGATLYRYFAMPVSRPDFPNIARWHNRLAEREPYRSSVMIPFDELRGRLAF